MPKQTYAENPVHPVINDYPAALVPTSVVFDMLHLVTRRGSFKVASFWTLLLAFVTGGIAAITGYRDYEEIPEHTEAKRIANAHALLNLGLLGSLAIQLLIRVTGKVGLFARLLNVVAAAGVVVSGWYGSHLVYRHGLRVRGVDPLGNAAEAGPDAGKAIAEQLESMLARVPDTDLSGYVRRAGEAASGAGEAAQGAVDTVSREVGTRVDAVRGQTGVADDAGDAWRAEEGQFDDQGALSGSIPEQTPADVAAAVRESLPDEQR